MTTPQNRPVAMDGTANDNDPNAQAKDATAFSCLLQIGELTAFSLDDLRNCPKERWLIHTVLPWADVAMVYGPSRIGKSFVVIDMAMCLSTGIPFAGIATDRVAVLYIATEGFNGIPKRILAWQQHHGKSDADSTIVVVKGRVDLYSEPGVKALVHFIRKVQEASGLEFRLIIIDTLAKAMGSAKENDNSDVTTVTLNAQRVGAAFGATVLLVHHTGKDEGAGPRGASAWTGNVNASIEVSRGQGDSRNLTLDKQKDEDDSTAFSFELERYKVGEDEAGRPITSCVAIIGRSTASKPQENTGRDEIKHMLALVKAAGASGIAWSDIYQQSPFAEVWKDRSATVRDWKNWLVNKGAIYETGPDRKRRLHFGSNPNPPAAA